MAVDGTLQPKAIFSLEAAKKLINEGFQELEESLKEKIYAEVLKEAGAKTDAVEIESIQTKEMPESGEQTLTRREARQLRRAESTYARVRDRLIDESAGYSKKARETYTRIFDEFNKLAPAEKKEFLELIDSGVRKPKDDSSRKYEGLFNALNDGVKARVITWSKSKKLLEFGIGLAFNFGKVSTGLAASIAGMPALSYGVDTLINNLKQGLIAAIYKLDKREEIGGVLKNEVLKRNIEAIQKDIQTLTVELDQEKPEWINKAKTMKPKEFEAEFAAHIAEKIQTLGLNDISSRLLEDLANKKNRKKDEKSTESGKKQEEQTAGTTNPEKTDPKKNMGDKIDEIIEELGE